MKSKRDELANTNKKFKEALENQLTDMKENVSFLGKRALWVGGSLLGTYILVNALSAKKPKKRKEKKEKRQKQEMERSPRDYELLSTVKEQAIIFALGLAAERLAHFLKNLEQSDETSSESTE